MLSKVVCLVHAPDFVCMIAYFASFGPCFWLSYLAIVTTLPFAKANEHVQDVVNV